MVETRSQAPSNADYDDVTAVYRDQMQTSNGLNKTNTKSMMASNTKP